MRKLILILLFLAQVLVAKSSIPIEYRVEAFGNTSTNSQIAPYYILANSEGIVTQSNSGYLRASAVHKMDYKKRFSFGFGIDLLGGVTSKSKFMTYNPDVQDLVPHELGASTVRFQQIYGELKYRKVYLTLGKKQQTSPLFNSGLDVGDFVVSNNARPIPGVHAGFWDFVDIPFTKGWIQMQGEYFFGKTISTKWREEHFNYAAGLLTTDYFFSNNYFYFRTKPEMPFSVTVGMRTARFIGGITRKYLNGELLSETKEKFTFKTLVHTILPGSGESSGNKSYFDGSSLGAWNLVARYRLKRGDELKFKIQFPFEDGSGIGKLNGWDGFYGIEYSASDENRLVSGAMIEYVDLMNQSGPIHWAPNDIPEGSHQKPSAATGSDNYYYNFQYKCYSRCGMAIGTPFIKTAIYDYKGFCMPLDSRLRGFQMGLKGRIITPLDYRILMSYRKSLGTYYRPNNNPLTDFSAMVELKYRVPKVEGLGLACRIAIDRGKLLGDNFGALINISYAGLFDL